MKNYSLGQKILGAIVGLFALFGITTAGVQLGSVSEGSAYNSTTTVTMTTPSAREQRTLKSNLGGTLGSVVIASTTAYAFTLMDATSTTDISSTTISRIATSTAAGTYTYDTAFTRGLIVDMPASFAGGYVVTWR